MEEYSQTRATPGLGLEFSPFPVEPQVVLFDSLAPTSITARGGPWGVPLQALLSLTLGLDIIHHGAGGLHNHITGPGTPSGVVHSPQGEPGRRGRASLAERS